jgi:hypothetical protein
MKTFLILAERAEQSANQPSGSKQHILTIARYAS